MKINKIIALAGIALAATTFQSCQKFYDINESPNNMKEVPVAQLLPSITSAVGYMGASDLYRYSGVIAQHFTGNTTEVSQTFKLYEQYRINNSDVNNQWSNMYSVALADIARLIPQAEAEGNPHYAGVAKILKAYIFQLLVDAWGDVPYSESGQFLDNLTPKFDKGEDIYADLINLLDDGIADINEANSVFSPTRTTTIYAGGSNWNVSKVKWEKFANTLKLRLFIHYSKSNPTLAQTKINELVNSGAQFMTSTSDNFEMPFLSESARRNPNQSIEGGQFKNAWFPNTKIVGMMNAKADPRRPAYFVAFPYNSSPATYKGGTAADDPTISYSRLNTFLKGSVTVSGLVLNPDGSIKEGISWNGAAPARLLTFAEYNFIRAEAAVRYNTPGGTAEEFFQAGIRASMVDAGVATSDINTYITAHGSLTGTPEQQIEKIISEKYVANWGVVMESWTDWRRTGYPALTPVANTDLGAIPRSLVYPQFETNSNPNAPAKPQGMLTRVFWDTVN